ncbi:junctional protein associated with coronary artery disease [Octodon degus]|uniref:Junctional protein associated with coronary artery disease n=1 Tax=Octodon degus TaxID=10160 RepID=A0A6P6DC31_OCTDE|nr:junctional protein associated with coronary artery disease [Octodon degus]XP_023557582.1 junctional protein associated with coronary artery disease [Octodon degus]
MYSVEDLLISHGYRPPRDRPGPHGAKADGHTQVRTRPRGSQGLQNGCEDGAATPAPSRQAPGTGPVSAPKGHRSVPRHHAEQHRTSASGASEAGFYNQPALVWSAQSQISNDQACWRRGQKTSSLLGPRDRDDLEVRGMAQPHSQPMHVREGPWDVGGRTEHVMKKAVWEDKSRMAGPAKWQNVSLESWNQPRKLGRHMSDGGGEKLFQDLYPFTQGEHALTSQNKKKSQSLPRVLSPESLSYMEIPIPLSDGHLPGIPKVPSYPPNCAPHSESTKNSEKAGSSAPFPRPKFGRPLKPLYSSHAQPRGREWGNLQDGQQMDLQGSCLARTSNPRHEPSVPDCGLEPPVYVPPPSYRSPPQHIPNPYLEDPVPRHVSDGHGPQYQPTEKPGASSPLPPSFPRTGNEYGASPGSPPTFPPHPHPVTAYEGSVQYIPFDDPRIRHIKLAQPLGFYEEVKPDDSYYDACPAPAPEPAQEKRHHDGATLNAQSLTPPLGTERGPAFVDPGPPWLWGQLLRDGEHAGFPDQREHCVARGQQAPGEGSQHGHAGGHVSSPDAQGSERTYETQTKLRMFETGIQTKKSSKKKTNETIFCLVSIPVKSESHLPEIDTNNNDLKQSADKKPGTDKSLALQEQSLLSMSSTDLELQALTRSMAGKTEFPKQDLGEPEGDKQTDDLRFIHLAKHRELKFSGSWPGHQYRDQQTQTSFPEESKSSQLLPASTPGELSSTAPTPKCLDPTDTHMHVPFQPSDQKQKTYAPNLKGQVSLSPSSNSAFSRTSLSTSQAPVPKAGQSQPCLDVHGQEASPVLKPEVVKGEPTAGPCNSKQLFGQFLLKPVSRRPWDLISQLESFNKELQEEEDSPDGSSGSSSEENEIERQEDCVGSRPRNWGFCEDSQEKRVKLQPRELALEDPECWSGRVESEPESWSEALKAGRLPARPQSPGFSQVKVGTGDPFESADENLVTEKRKQGIINGIDELEVSPGPVRRVISSRPSDRIPVVPSWLAEPREPAASEKLTDALSSAQLSREVPLEVDSAEERDTGVLLTLTNKSRGLSAPDLRSVGLMMRPEPSASELDRPLGEGSTVEIPPSESLQARAARILGIEVAMESLLPGTRTAGPNQSPEPDASACSLAPPREEPLPSSATSFSPTATTDSFYGRRKCGWTQSPLFVGERAPQVSEHSVMDEVLTSQDTRPEPQLGTLESKSLEQKLMGPKPPFRSTLFHVIERTPNVSGLEKRLRSPSKVIESLQEKLTSPTRRADPGRLIRMKEVSSVSRMRSLSFRNTESTEEAEELKAERGQAWQPQGPTPLSRGDQVWRVGHPPSISKGIVTFEENGHVVVQSKKSKGQDFWCPESYDPSRVERV